MKGIIFTTFTKMIEEKFGLEMLDELIVNTKPKSEGIYISTATYEDAELINMVVYLSKKIDVPVEDLVRTFGHFTFQVLSKSFPHFLENKTFKDFILSVHDVVHVEVKKLYPEAELPTFIYKNIKDNSLTMKYISNRNLPTLAEGLIQGAADYYNKNVKITLTECSEENNCYNIELSFD